MTKITHEELLTVLDYDKNTGVFTWKIHTTNTKIGQIAGNRKENDTWYRLIRYKGKGYLAHRLAWFYVNCEWPNGIVDHIDRDKDNNRIANLRIVTAHENAQNINKHNGAKKKNKSKYIGVSRSSTGKWYTRIMAYGKNYYGGSYDTELEAHNAYLELKQKLHIQ
jgi:hypothetical protein